MGGTEIVLVVAVIFVPLVIAVAVTLWTLEPAAQRAERAKRGRKRAGTAVQGKSEGGAEPTNGIGTAESAAEDESPTVPA